MSNKDKPIEGKVIKEGKNSKAIKRKEAETTIVTKGFAENLLNKAIDKDVSVETIEKLLAMRRELKTEYAKEEFDKAMAKFQSDCPEIKKTKAVKTRSGQLAYKYAPIEVIVKQVKSVLKKNGFSYSIQTEVKDNKVKSICIIKHNVGHRENYEMEVPLGNKTPVMSDSQVVAAASTFSKRYAFCNAFGILTGDEDNDGDTKSVQSYTPPNSPEASRNAPQRQSTPPTTTVKKPTGTATGKPFCVRCNKNGKKVFISQAEAEFSKKHYKFTLCRDCQKLARKHKNIAPSPPIPKQENNSPEKSENINGRQVSMIRSLGKQKLKENDDIAIMAFLQMHGINSTQIGLLSYKEGMLAIKVLTAYKGD